MFNELNVLIESAGVYGSGFAYSAVLAVIICFSAGIKDACQVNIFRYKELCVYYDYCGWCWVSGNWKFVCRRSRDKIRKRWLYMYTLCYTYIPLTCNWFQKVGFLVLSPTVSALSLCVRMDLIFFLYPNDFHMVFLIVV